MKKLYYILFAFLIILTGCTEFLTLEPQDELVKEEYWKTEDDVKAVLLSDYARMGDFLDEIFKWAELRGGLFTPNSRRVSDESYLFFNYNIDETNILVKWNDFYKVINIANTIIDYAPLAKENDKTFSDEASNGYMAEAYFIRSLSYFYLVKAFKDVPLILHPYATDQEDLNVEKSDEKVIIKQLIEDLNYVLDNNLAFKTDYFSTPALKKGRANVNAIYALLADIYLWNNDYSDCIATCEKIKDVYLVDGNDYFSLYANDGNSLESIFELQFNYAKYRTTNRLYYMTSQTSASSFEYLISEYMMELYGRTDLREYNGQELVSYAISDVAYLWKYVGNAPFGTVNGPINRNNITSDANWIFYRYAEIYLMEAEAYAEIDDYSNAIETLNVIKKRANIDPFPESTDKKAILKEILDERAREFVGEGKRWFDLVRITRRDIDNRLNFISNAVIPNVDPMKRSFVNTRINDMNTWFLPIYYTELDLNKNLKQNPSYE